ncbi:MAG: Mut7-C RNAse domain-containing protein [Chloroflexi bacterium]|nr:Mut7-C RNAse domain-containing protein [Chloroflexota bacterium]
MNPPRFLVDAHLGRLVKSLRSLGYDAVLARHEDDDTVIRRALKEDRVLLTRDLPLARRRVATRGPLRVLYLRGETPATQLQEIASVFGLSTDRAFTRCLLCNVPLEPRSKEEVTGRVPPYVYAHRDRFNECPSCHRLYWRGTHWDHMKSLLASSLSRGLGTLGEGR